MIRVVTVGETMGLAVNNQPGHISSSRAASLSFGGAESNVAVGLSRLGTEAAWVSRLGDDPFGQLITRELAAEGVHVRVTVDAGRQTGFMHKHRRTTNAASVTFWRKGSAASALSPSDVPASMIADAEVLHLTGILPGLSNSARQCALYAAQVAREADTLVSLDINHRSKVWAAADPVPVYRELIELSDIVFGGREEVALVMAGDTPRALARAVQNVGPREVIIKLGADGAVSAVGGEVFQEPAVAVEVVDTVGAGDAFVAGYLHGLLNGASPQERLIMGTRAGALACTVPGDWEGAPTQGELVSLVAAERVFR